MAQLLLGWCHWQEFTQQLAQDSHWFTAPHPAAMSNSLEAGRACLELRQGLLGMQHLGGGIVHLVAGRLSHCGAIVATWDQLQVRLCCAARECISIMAHAGSAGP